jgi:phospholipid transport system substrate-binding protein
MGSLSLARGLLAAVLLSLVAASGSAWAGDSAPSVETDAAQSPRAVVESLHATLIACMKGECGPGFEGRYERILAQLDQSFDLPFMARISIDKAWKTLSPEDQLAFVELSRSYSASNYASNFDSYGGQTFETLGEEPAARGTILVKTELVQPNDDNVRFDYRLRKSGSGWRIIDVTLDGKVSEITMRRADYGAVIEREGYASLVRAIESKIAKLASD